MATSFWPQSTSKELESMPETPMASPFLWFLLLCEISLTFLYLSIFPNQLSRYPGFSQRFLSVPLSQRSLPLSWSLLVSERFLLWFFHHLPSPIPFWGGNRATHIQDIMFWSLAFIENHRYWSSQHLPRSLNLSVFTLSLYCFSSIH